MRNPDAYRGSCELLAKVVDLQDVGHGDPQRSDRTALSTEAMTLQLDGGMAAVLAPTWTSKNFDGVRLFKQFIPQLYDPALVRVGDAVQGALRAYAAAGGKHYVLDTYNLVGDPGLEMRWR